MDIENNVGQIVENLEQKILKANVSSPLPIPPNHNPNQTNVNTPNSTQKSTPALTTIITTTTVNDPTNHDNTLSTIPTPLIEPVSHDNNSNQARIEEIPPPKAVGFPPDPNSDSQQQTGDKLIDTG